jgi:hypothetical protein
MRRQTVRTPPLKNGGALEETTTGGRDLKSTPDILRLQAARLERRFGLTASTAATVAVLAYAEAAQ